MNNADKKKTPEDILSGRWNTPWNGLTFEQQQTVQRVLPSVELARGTGEDYWDARIIAARKPIEMQHNPARTESGDAIAENSYSIKKLKQLNPPNVPSEIKARQDMLDRLSAERAALIKSDATASGASEKNAPPAQVVTLAARGITKQQVMDSFEGMQFDREHWGRNLATPPDWLICCRVSRGNKSTSALWNPALIAVALCDKSIPLKKLDAVFVGLRDWADEWSEVSAIFRQ